MKTVPALDIRTASADWVLAIVDDFAPTAVDETLEIVRVFFARPSDRDAAQAALAERFDVAPIDVPDDDWGRRSQADLQPVVVDRLAIIPNPQFNQQSAFSNQQFLIVIPPSMAFGTGHHATTRLCLEALQTLDLAGAQVLDVGTGSGILAIAAVKLGAARAHGIDSDHDAIQTARDNLTHNPDVAAAATFAVDDLASLTLDRTAAYDVVIANLTGALLCRSSARLLDAVHSGGTLILGGIQTEERDDVLRAFGEAPPVWERAAGEWVGLAMKKA